VVGVGVSDHRRSSRSEGDGGSTVRQCDETVGHRLNHQGAARGGEPGGQKGVGSTALAVGPTASRGVQVGSHAERTVWC
jgi:hypothetical protein